MFGLVNLHQLHDTCRKLGNFHAAFYFLLNNMVQ